MNELTSIDKIELYETFARQAPQVDLPLEHIFASGVYCRHLSIPKGIVLTGEIHKTRNLNILLKGRMKVLIGDDLRDIEAPFVIVSPAGIKRIAEALEDCIWLTIHATQETDINKIKDDFVVATKQEYLEYIAEEPMLPFKELQLCTV